MVLPFYPNYLKASFYHVLSDDHLTQPSTHPKIHDVHMEPIGAAADGRWVHQTVVDVFRLIS